MDLFGDGDGFQSEDPLIGREVPWVEKRARSLRGPSNPEYEAKHPEPNYSEFKRPEFVDLKGRQYRLAKKGVDARASNLQGADIVLHVRLPIRRGGSRMELPQPDEDLLMLQLRTQRLTTARVVETYFSPRAATGRVSVEALLIGNPVADPSLWKHVMPGKGPKRSERQGIDG